MTVLGVILGVIILSIVSALPITWLLMLALGSFGFTQFGFVACIPAGFLLSALFSSSRSSN